MTRRIGFTVSSAASEGHRRNWLGVKSWQWSKLRHALTRPLICKESPDIRGAIRAGILASGALFVAGLALSYAGEPSPEEIHFRQVTALSSCMSQTRQVETCKALYVMQGGKLNQHE